MSDDLTSSLLISDLNRFVELVPADIEALSALEWISQPFNRNDFVLREGLNDLEKAFVLRAGLACRQKTTREGHRSIFTLFRLGSLLNIDSAYSQRLDHAVQCLVPSEVAFTDRQRLLEIIEASPRIKAAIATKLMDDHRVLQNRFVTVSRQDAKCRVAHLIYELMEPSETKQDDDAPSRILLTQEQIGDATGLTSVHVNRMLKQLWIEGLIKGVSGGYIVTDWTALKRASDFGA